MTNRIAVVCAALLSAAVAAPSSGKTITRARYLMGTVCEITAPAGSEARIDAAFREAARIERFLSTWRNDSELSGLNAAHEANVSPELSQLLERAIGWANATGSAFNPLVGPIIQAWRTRAEGAVPSNEAINAAVARASVSNVTIAGNVVLLANDAEFEEGGFGKGYAIDRMLLEIDSPSVTINFGGQLGVRGESRVTIADPERRDLPVVALTIRDASLSTSSGSEKSFECGGVRFTHIVDPRTGRALPPRGSVSVVATSAFDADVLSTALYVMGVDEGLRWADAQGVAAIFINPQRDVRVSAAARRNEIQILDRHFELKD